MVQSSDTGGGAGGGALGGAASGAAAGSFLGPWGMLAGGAIGAAFGAARGDGANNKPIPGGFWHAVQNVPPKDWAALQNGLDPANARLAQDTVAKLATGAQDRQAPQIQGATFAVDPTARQGMLDTAGRLQGIASGQQMGAGELALNRQIGQATAQQMAAARMAQGANSALALRQMMRGNADLRLAGAGQAAQARMQDQGQANAQLGSLYGNLYGQDAAIAAQNAQFGQQAAISNQQARLQQQGMNDALQIQALGQMLGWDQQTINAHLAAIQQQRANQEGPNVGASLLQGAGALLPVIANMWKGQQTPISAPADPDALMKPGG